MTKTKAAVFFTYSFFGQVRNWDHVATLVAAHVDKEIINAIVLKPPQFLPILI